MKIQKILSQNRRDFRAIYECEHCGHTETGYGYDDANFHNNVIPDKQCKKCGKKAPSDHRPLTTKYPDYMEFKEMKLKQHKIYTATIKIRPDVKPGLTVLEGKTFEFYCAWYCEPEERYPGESAMMPWDEEAREAFLEVQLPWIASGDLTDIKEVQDEINS